MASQPSVHNEERNLLRLRAWEQRNQEASQTKDLNLENVPLFREPYKTNKGDELSHRIQRMLGCYEDVTNPCSNAIESLPIPTCVSFLQSDQGWANAYKSTKTQLKLYNQALPSQSQKGPSSNSSATQPVRTSTTSSLPSQHGHSSPFSKTSLNQSQGSQFRNSVYQQQKSEASSDLREYDNLLQESSASFPDSKPLPLQHSSDNNIDMDTREIFDRHQLQGSADYPSGSSSTMDVSTLNIKQSPKDGSLPQAKTNTLPSQTFPSLLSSKQPGTVMTQKPTAYVRPMDGQDQMVSESPDLKPSPEHYAPLPELISKSDLVKTKTTTEEAQFVKDILREMTHSWPPLLTAIQTPTIDEPSKSLFTAKEAECVSSCPVQKNLNSCPPDQSHFSQQRSSTSCEVARSSGIETSSSDSDSSPGSESDSENSTEEPRPPPEGSAVKAGPDAPAVSHGDWQLGNWIRSSQQNSSSEGRGDTLVSENPFHKLPPHAQTSKKPSVEPTEDCEPQLSSHQKELTDKLAIPQQCSENPQDNHCFQQSCTEYPPADVRSCSNSKKHSEPAAAAAVSPGCNKVAFNLKCGDVVTTQRKDPSYTDTPKVKTKTRHCKKDKGDSKKDIRRSKHAKRDKQKAGAEVAPLYGHCSSCGVRAPHPCSCPAQSPAQRDQVSPAPPLGCNKPKAETCDQNSTKMPPKSTHKDSERSGNASKGCWDHYQPPRSLLVKIDLSLLSQANQTSNIHKRISSSTKRPALVIEELEGASDAAKTHRQNKTSKKSQNVNAENKIPSKKKQKLENKNTPSTHTSLKQEIPSNPAEARVRKKAKKHFQDPTASKDTIKHSKLEKCCSGKTQESTKEAVKKKDSHKHNKSHTKQTQHREKRKPPKSSRDVPSGLQPRREPLINRPLLTFDESQYPVKHYIKEAKRLKHKADAESDKLSKAFSYLEAAMFFVESGIAMEKDPHISMSSYTMFAETVELLKFVIKLKNPVDSSAPSSEKDFLALCMRCQCLLQMAMFHHKRKTALMYSKTLTDHFHNFTQEPHNPPASSLKITGNPSPSIPSPSSSSGPGSNHSASGSGVGPAGPTVTVPQEIEQVAFTYVSITTLFLSAHDFWEQAEELARKGSGVLADLDTVLGPLSLASSLSSMVCYTRQGIHWLRLDSQKV